jgi:hypothetical protein
MTPDANPPHPTSISSGPGVATPQPSAQPRELRSVRQTGCCVVGAGPAGAMLALLLARQRVPVVLLEAHGDFDRDFRGDSLQPAIMRVMDELGLADELLELPHRKLRQATLPANPPITVDLSRLPGRFPYIGCMVLSVVVVGSVGGWRTGRPGSDDVSAAGRQRRRSARA